MSRTTSLLLPGALLLLGGVFLAILGIRSGERERASSVRRAAERTRIATRTVVEHVQSQALQPSTPPREVWELYTAPLDAHRSPDGEEVALLAAHAEYTEQTLRDAGEAASLYARLVGADETGWTSAAALRAGALSRQAGRPDDARRLLERASDAPSKQVDTAGDPPIRLLALYGLATLDPDRWEPTFLKAAGEGGVISPAGRLGPDDLILGLAEHIPRPSRALREALARTRRGQRALAATSPSSPAGIDDGMVLLRRPNRVEARAPQALLHGIAVTGVRHLDLVEQTLPPKHGGISIPLEPPLEALVLRGRAPSPPSRPPRTGLIVVLFVYGISSIVALLGLYRALRAAQAQADFLAEVSHELKTPIASVRAMAEFLADGPADDEAKVRDYARRIEGEMGRLGTSVRNVLDAARIERKGGLPVTLRPGDPADVVETLAAAIGPGLTARGFTIDVRVAPATSPVLLDAAALQSALTNLVDNAAKFSGGARTIEIEAGPAALGYRIAVRDRGRGIDAKGVEHLFRRFERGDSVRRDAVPGVGLGLYIVHEIVEAHHGTVVGSPREGGGAVFTIDLPPGGEGASVA